MLLTSRVYRARRCFDALFMRCVSTVVFQNVTSYNGILFYVTSISALVDTQSITFARLEARQMMFRHHLKTHSRNAMFFFFSSLNKAKYAISQRESSSVHVKCTSYLLANACNNILW